MVWVVFGLQHEFGRWMLDVECGVMLLRLISRAIQLSAINGLNLQFIIAATKPFYEAHRQQPAVQQHKEQVRLTVIGCYVWCNKTKNGAASKDTVSYFISMRLCWYIESLTIESSGKKPN